MNARLIWDAMIDEWLGFGMIDAMIICLDMCVCVCVCVCEYRYSIEYAFNRVKT